MWTKKNYFIWFEISKGSGKVISFPISLFAFNALFQSVLELITAVTYLIPGLKVSTGKTDDVLTGQQIRHVLDVFGQMFVILAYEHHLDLVDVVNKNTHVKIALR